MEETIFTFVGSIFGHGAGLVIGHLVLVTLIIIAVATMATKNLNVAPKGMQNVMSFTLAVFYRWVKML